MWKDTQSAQINTETLQSFRRVRFIARNVWSSILFLTKLRKTRIFQHYLGVSNREPRILAKYIPRATVTSPRGAWRHMPPNICCPPPPCAPQMRSALCIKMHQKIFLKYYAANKHNGMKCDCIRIHALHGCVINNVIIQSTSIASLPATSFPGSYLRSSGEMTRCW